MHKKLEVTKRLSPVNGMPQYFIKKNKIEYEIKSIYVLCKNTTPPVMACKSEAIAFELSQSKDFHVYLTLDHALIVYEYRYFIPGNMFSGGKKYKKVKITSER